MASTPPDPFPPVTSPPVTTPVPPAPPVPPVPPAPTEPTCAQEATRIQHQKEQLQMLFDGALGNVDRIITAAQEKANSYPANSPCRLAFQAYVDRIKAERDRIFNLFTQAMLSDMTVDCSNANWKDQVHTIDLLQGQIMNYIDLLDALYRLARKKTIPSDCEDFNDYEPDVELCSRVTGDAEMCITAGKDAFDAMIRKCTERMDATTDQSAKDMWLSTRLNLQTMKTCFISNMPADVSCSHKYWENRKHARLGAAMMMKDVAECLRAQMFGE